MLDNIRQVKNISQNVFLLNFNLFDKSNERKMLHINIMINHMICGNVGISFKKIYQSIKESAGIIWNNGITLDVSSFLRA